MNDLLHAFILLFSVIDPIGTIPMFVTATNQYDAQTRKKVAINGVLIAMAIFLFFIIAGQVVIEHMEISLSAFQVAGGLVFLLFAIQMVLGNEGHGTTDENADHRHIAVFPVALPSIASPGAILAVVLLTDNNKYNFGQQAAVTGILVLILGITLLLLLSAGRIQKAIGKIGITVITKIMGLLLCGLAVESILSGIKTYFKLG